MEDPYGGGGVLESQNTFPASANPQTKTSNAWNGKKERAVHLDMRLKSQTNLEFQYTKVTRHLWAGPIVCLSE